jgi:hypothetical protein
MENIIEFLKSTPRGGATTVVASEVANRILDGYEDGLELFIAVKSAQKLLDDITAQIEESALNSAMLYSSKSFDAYGAKIEIREVGTKYNFDNCGDTILARITEEKKKWSDEEKSRQSMLKTLRGKTEMLDPETGEVINVFPPQKSSKTGLVVTLPRN